MTPLGPRDSDAEREPNSDDLHAEPYGVGQLRKGRLTTAEDIDYFRFTLAAPERIRLRIEQPQGGDVEFRLVHGGEQIVRQRASEPGAAIELDLLLEPGDQLLTIWPRQPSEGTYELTTERLGPYGGVVDQERNDDVASVRPVPASLMWGGDSAGANRDYDWFELPPLSETSTVTVHHSDERPGIWLYAGEAVERLRLDRVEDGVFSAVEVPVGEPLYLQLEAVGPYDVRLESEGWTSTEEPVAPDIEMSLVVDSDTIAAYWSEAQRVHGSLSVRNVGAEPVELGLEGTTSHYAWQASLAERSLLRCRARPARCSSRSTCARMPGPIIPCASTWPRGRRTAARPWSGRRWSPRAIRPRSGHAPAGRCRMPCSAA
jgi:hypothetical protein